jgi:hypothetical protein
MSAPELRIQYLRRSQGRAFAALLIVVALAPMVAIALVVLDLRQAATWASLSHTSLSAAFRLWFGGVDPKAAYPGTLVLALDQIENAMFAVESIPVMVFLLFRLRQRRRRERVLLALLESRGLEETSRNESGSESPNPSS